MRRSDANSIEYFWNKKRDFSHILTPEAEKTNPLLVKAWKDYVLAEQLLDLLVHNLNVTEEDSD